MHKKLKFMFVFIIVVLFICKGFTIDLFSKTDKQKEGRAVWISANMFSMEKEEAVSQIKELLNKYSLIGINNLFCFSSMMYQNQKKWDFLEILLKETHKKNIKVHPIFCPYREVKLEGEIKEHPEWLIRGKKGEIYLNLNMANPEAREYFKREIIKALKYNVDGIHLDGIRFPINQGFSYDKVTCEVFKKEFGFSPLEVHQDCGSMVWCEWIKWNANHITTLVREIKEIIEKSGKDVVLGVDVFPDAETAKVLIGQDWELWAKEGLVDIICPMQYTNNLDMFRKSIKKAVIIARGKCLVYSGIGIRSSHNINTPEGVVQEVKLAREEGADGVVFFFGTTLTDKFINKLKSDVFK